MTDFDPGTTNILGRFDNSPMETERDFVVPPNTDQLVIEFDFFGLIAGITRNSLGSTGSK